MIQAARQPAGKTVKTFLLVCLSVFGNITSLSHYEKGSLIGYVSSISRKIMRYNLSFTLDIIETDRGKTGSKEND